MRCHQVELAKTNCSSFIACSQEPTRIHVHHHVLHSPLTLILISLLVGTCIALDASRRSIRDEGSTLNPIIPNLRFSVPVTSPSSMRKSGAGSGPANPAVLSENRRRADRARRTFVGRAMGVVVAGILLNEETPSWGDGAVGLTIYAGQSFVRCGMTCPWLC
jgi:hypothetical protein